MSRLPGPVGRQINPRFIVQFCSLDKTNKALSSVRILVQGSHDVSRNLLLVDKLFPLDKFSPYGRKDIRLN